MLTMNNRMANIIWYDLREKYLDERIYPSMKKSIIENFAFRLLSQDKNDEVSPFPIKLIRSIFTNAAKLKNYSEDGELDKALLDECVTWKINLETFVWMTVERISLCVATPEYEVSDKTDSNTGLPQGMWMYPVGAIKKLGFETSTGEIFIQIYREENNIRQLYSPNPTTQRWEKVTGVEKLSQLYLRRVPEMKNIMEQNSPDLSAISKIVRMNLNADMLKAKDYKEHRMQWGRLLPLLPELLREILAILTQYNVILTLRDHKR